MAPSLVRARHLASRRVARLGSLALGALLGVALVTSSGESASGTLAEYAARARADAKKWRADAQLVQVQIVAFDFGIGPTGMPDTSLTGPPHGVFFRFLSPSSGQAMVVVADISRGTSRVQPEATPSSPYTLAIPDDLAINAEPAIAQAKKTIATECAGGNPLTSRSCPVVTGAELHVEGAGPSARAAVWTIRFGQNPRTFRAVTRAVDARTGQLIASKINEAGADEATGVIPAIPAVVVGLQFFESPAEITQRSYDDLFFYNAARYIYWELQLFHPPPHRHDSFTLEEIWKYPGGEVAWRATRTFTVEPDLASSTWFSGARLAATKTVEMPNLFYEDCMRRNQTRSVPQYCPPTTGVDIEQWPRGMYEVDIVVDRRLVATGTFEMRAKDQIYEEVKAKAVDRSAPVGTIDELDARVTALRFFEAGAAMPAPPQRAYSTRFSRATTHDIVWELDLAHPPPHRWLGMPIEALLFFRDATGERLLQRKVSQAAVPADWPDTHQLGSLGWDNDYYYQRTGPPGPPGPGPRSWMTGTYRVDLWAGGVKVASGSFEVR